MEKDDEIKGNGNSLDFGARIYDSRLGRFLSLDLLNKITPYYSPYLFAGNKPISAIDNGGLIEIIVHYLHKSSNGKITEKRTLKYQIATAEEIKTISTRSTMHINVYTEDVPKVVGNNTTFQYKFIKWEIVKGTGETQMENLKRTSPFNYYGIYLLSKFMINNPIGTGQMVMATQNTDPITGEYRSNAQNVISFFQGLADMATFGIASRTGTSAATKYMINSFVDLGMEEAISKLAETFELTNNQKLIFSYHLLRFTASVKSGKYNQSEEFQKLIIQFIDKGIKGAELVEQFRQRTGVNLDMPIDKEAAAEQAVEMSKNER